MNQRPVFVVGAGSRSSRGGEGVPESGRIQEVTAAIAELGLHWERLPDLAALRDALEGEEKPGREPLAVFVPAGGKLLSDACLALRAHARFAQVPAFGIAANPDDLTFVDLFQSGGDDLVPPLRSSVLRRLRPLLTRAAGEPPSRRAATVIIAGSDRIWRSVLGRTFWNGGLSVRFADDPAQCVADGGAEGVRLVVVLDEEGRSTVDYVRKARAAGQTAPWIVVAPPRRLREVSAELRGIEKAAATDAFAPPENVLFLANELGRPRGEDARASARLLFGTRVSFRVAGRETDEVGFTYNMSAGGLYVRTAAPVDPGDDVWLELWPPRSERRVRLIGRVAWRRHLGPNDFATVPAGFGVQLTDGLGGDLDRWKAGYRAYAAQILGPNTSAIPQEDACKPQR